MSPAVSIRDIAKAAGVSHTTVSRALRNSPLISGEVREDVQRIARQMGYTPNIVARSLKERRTNTIGLVVTSIADPFVGRVARGIEEVAASGGIDILLSISRNDPEQEMAVIESLHRRRVDGIIVAAGLIGEQYAGRLARIDVPTVLINQQAEAQYDTLHSVSVDDYGGARFAMEHLLSCGHHAIGYLGAGNRPRSNRRRLEAYCDALADAGVHFEDDRVRIAARDQRFHTDDVAAGQALVPELLAARVSAVFCYNDMIAVGALMACRELGVKVPEQLSVVGYDDIELAQYVTPALTTIHQPKLRLGQLAMEMLLDLMAGQHVDDRVLETALICRASTTAP
jgi:DNA-binding LacI/PurR family transcriptional regulator